MCHSVPSTHLISSWGDKVSVFKQRVTSDVWDERGMGQVSTHCVHLSVQAGRLLSQEMALGVSKYVTAKA